jgi:hypothetical protein
LEHWPGGLWRPVHMSKAQGAQVRLEARVAGQPVVGGERFADLVGEVVERKVREKGDSSLRGESGGEDAGHELHLHRLRAAEKRGGWVAHLLEDDWSVSGQ